MKRASDEADDDTNVITDLQYVQDFSYNEIDMIIDSLRQSIRLKTTECEELIDKVEHILGNRYYRERLKRKKAEKAEEIPVDVFSSGDDELVANNIRVIREAIDRKKKITFLFNVLTGKQDDGHDYEITGLPNPLNPREYMHQHLYMFFGEPKWIDLRVDKRSLYIIIDILDIRFYICFSCIKTSAFASVTGVSGTVLAVGVEPQPLMIVVTVTNMINM